MYNAHNLVCSKLKLNFQSILPRQKSISVANNRKIKRTIFVISNYGTLITCILRWLPELLCRFLDSFLKTFTGCIEHDA